MKYGYFDDKTKEYVITAPETPLPWINYLGCQDYFALVSNSAGGYAFYRDARLRRITRYRYNASPLDSDGFHIYIKEGGSIWNPGWQPVQTELDSYECRHGLGYTTIKGSLNGLEAVQTMYVPINDNCLLIRLKVTNHSSVKKMVQIFPYIEFCLWDAMDDSTNFQRNYSTGEVEAEDNVIYHKTEYRERRSHYAFFWTNSATCGFETGREAFTGVYGSPAAPSAVINGSLTGSCAHGWQPVAAFQHDLELAGGESKELIFGLGYAENPPEEKWAAPGIINKDNARKLISRHTTSVQFESGLKELADFWTDLTGRFNVSTGSEKLDRMVNIWNQYQCMVTFNMSRSASYFESGMGRGMGFRDSCQDLLGFVHMIPERARERILDIAATQFPDGSAYHQYQPLTKKGNSDIGSGFNDDPLWLIAGTDAYLRETGDFSILEEETPFNNDENNTAPLMEHLRRSFNYTLNNRGPHGLPLIGRADWNDCLNLNCFSTQPGESFQTTGPSEGPVAESVFIAGMFVKYGAAYAEICRKTGLEEEAGKALEAVSEMTSATISAGWDGEWFLRAYDAAGDPVGSSTCDEGQIFIEPQGMCVMAGIGLENGMAEAALRSVKERLDTKYGIVLLQPPYTGYRPELGEITSYPPGYKENAGIFCHNNPWIICAETTLGHGDRAFELYKKFCPAFIEDISDIHRTEPYVYSQMIAGKDAPSFGEAKNSWLTGTAAWTFVSISQAILGIIPTLDGLKIDPCLPGEIPGYTAKRHFRGALYEISVEKGHPDKGISVNGTLIEGNVIPVQPEGSTVKIKVMI